MLEFMGECKSLKYECGHVWTLLNVSVHAAKRLSPVDTVFKIHVKRITHLELLFLYILYIFF